MIRKEPNHSVGWNTDPRAIERYVVLSPDGFKWTVLIPDSRDSYAGGPFAVGVVPGHPMRHANGRFYWVYRGNVYSTKEDLDAEAVEALILEAENKVKIRVTRAKALMVQARSLDEAATQGKRPPIPDDVKMYVWQRDGGKCVKCGSTRNLEYDHDIPFSLGGSNTARNLRLLCETCNRSKGASLI